MSRMNLVVKVKTVYGKELIYPVCDKAQIFVSMLDKKTFGKSDIINLKKLGYEITVQTPTIF